MRWALLLLLTGCTVYDFPPPAEPDPIALRSPLAVQGGPLLVVNNEEELRQEIARAGLRVEVDDDGFPVEDLALRIVIPTRIALTQTLVIPSKLAGLVLDGQGVGVLDIGSSASAVVQLGEDGASVSPARMTLRGLGIEGAGTGVTWSAAAFDITLDDIRFGADLANTIDGSNALTRARIINCRFPGGGTTTITSIVNSIFSGNMILHDITFTVGVDCAISNNSFNGLNLDLSGGGTNAVTGNSEFGTYLPGTGDQAAGNT